jgi:putative ABC transport system substrate-binding protein
VKRREFITLIGGAAAWPLAARAQQGERMRLVGILAPISADTPGAKADYAAFLEGLQQLGWTPGRDVRIEVRWGEGDEATIGKYAAELVALAPDVLVAPGGAAVEVMLKVTHTIPIVFAVVPDPVGSGFVESLSQPGGTATGFMMFEYNLCGKWLELLKEIAPNVTHAAVLRDHNFVAGIGQFAVIQSVAALVGIEVRPIDLREPAQIERANRGLRTLAEWRNNLISKCVRGSQCQFDHRSGRTL